MIEQPPVIPTTPEEEAALKAVEQELAETLPAHERYLKAQRELQRIISRAHERHIRQGYD